MAWPTDPLDLRVELSIAGTWTDTGNYPYQRTGTSPPAVIQRGRPDESAQMNPSSATFELNNRDGRFSPKNPVGPYYGNFGRNTPVRLSIPAQSNYLRLENSLARAYVNDTGGGSPLSISGSIEMRIQVDLADWQGATLAGKWDFGACWLWALNSDGTLAFSWLDAGSVQHVVTSTVPVPFFRGQQALRVKMDATSGQVTFSTAATIDGSYTQLGGVNSGTGGAATSIVVNHSSALVTGYSFTTGVQAYGRVYEYRLYNGIAGAGGTVAADGVFSAQAAGATTWTDSAANTWLLASGGEISARDYRYHGECSAVPPKWDITGTDQSVQVTAGGIWRRLGQGRSPVQSPMKRVLTTRTGTLVPVAYWPCEDAAGATSFGSAVGGGLMTFDGSPTLASDSSFPGSQPLPQVQGSRWHGKVAPYTSNGSIIVRWLCKPGSSGVNAADVVRILCTGTCQAVSVSWYTGAGNMGITGWSGGASVFTSGSVNFAANLPGATLQQPLWMSLELRPSGGNINWGLVMIPLGATTGQQATGTVAGTIGTVTDVYVDPDAAFTDWVIGHVSAQSDWESLFDAPLYNPFNAWAGELAANRFSRLCGEAGIAARVIGSPSYSAAMGGQQVDTLTNLLQACEDADQGQLHEPRQVLGLAFRTSASMCNQAARVTVDYAQAELGGGGTGLAPTYDDQRLRNDATVTRSTTGTSAKGTSYEYQLNDGSALAVAQVGDYNDTLTANVATDRQVPNLARWKVHVGTVDEARWPSVPFNLRRAAIQNNSLYYPLLSVDSGDYVQIVNMPSVILHDPVKQLASGMKESLGGYHHVLELNAVPESPWEVLILDDATYGRADTDGSSLASQYDGTLAPSPAAWWKLADAAGSGTAADSSGNSHAGTATSVTFGQASTPVYPNTTASFNGTSSTVLTSYNPALAAVTVDGWVNPSSISGSPRLIANSHTDLSTDKKGFEVQLSSGKPQAWIGNGTASANVLASAALVTGTWYHVAFTYDGTTVSLYVNGVLQATSTAVSGTLAAGTAAGIGLGYNPSYSGDFFSGLLAEWTVTASALTGAQVLARYNSAAGAYTSAATTLYVATAAGFPVWTQAAGDLPFDAAVSGERMTVTAVSGATSPQQFTVTRAVNGVAKAQAVAADVRLWSPPILAYQ